MLPAPVGYEASEIKIDSLLDDIAEARIRLQNAIERGRDQHDLLEENQRRLKHTFSWINQRADLEGMDLSARPRKPPKTCLTDRLTPREIEVLRLIAEGYSTKEIAARLNMAFKTAVCHRSHILEKLHCHESASLVRFALQAGLVA